MSNRVKVLVVLGRTFDRQTGAVRLETLERHRCVSCLNFVEPGDKYCWGCGEELVDSPEVRYTLKHQEITLEQYQRMQTLPKEELKVVISGILQIRKEGE